MPASDDSGSSSQLPRHLRKDPKRLHQRVASRFNFSWIGGMAQQLRNALSSENKTEVLSVRRQSEDARRFRQNELEAHRRESLRLSFAKENAASDVSPAFTGPPNNANGSNGSIFHSSRPVTPLATTFEANPPQPVEAALAIDASSQIIPSVPSEPKEHSSHDVGADYHMDEDHGEELNGNVISGLLHSADIEEELDSKSLAPETGGSENIEESLEEHSDEELIDNLDDENLDDENLDESLDLDDLDAEDLDAEDVDADDMDLDDLDAEALDSEDVPQAGPEHEHYSEGGLKEVDEKADDVVSFNKDAYDEEEGGMTPVDPSDHEALEYDAERSSMSLWESAGFQPYDTVGLGIDHDFGEPQADIEAGTPPEAAAVFHDDAGPFVAGHSPANDTEVDRAGALDKEKEAVPQARLSMSGSQLDPSERYLGFHFGPSISSSVKEDHATDAAATGSSIPAPLDVGEPSHCLKVSGDAQSQPLSERDIGAHSSSVKAGNDDEISQAVSLRDSNDRGEDRNGHATADGANDDHSNENSAAGRWNLFNVGFNVAPIEDLASDRSSRRFEPSVSVSSTLKPKLKPVEPEVSLEEEFHILAQTAHRVMAASSLFGGAPVPSPERKKTVEDLAPVDNLDPEVENRRVTSIAHGLFSNSPLFGGKPAESIAVTAGGPDKALTLVDQAQTQGEEVVSVQKDAGDRGEDQTRSSLEDDRNLADEKMYVENSRKREGHSPTTGVSVSEPEPVAKRRRLRPSKKASEAANEPAEEESGANAEASEPTSTQKTAGGRTRPLTRAALRAQKRKAAEDKVDAPSPAEHESMATLDTELQIAPATKKRKSAPKKTSVAKKNRRNI